MKKITSLALILIATVCTLAKPGSILKNVNDKVLNTQTTETTTKQDTQNMDNKAVPKVPDGYYVNENGASLYGNDLQIVF